MPPAETLPLTRSVDELQQALAEQRYMSDRGLAVSIYLALRLRRPLFLEGEAGRRQDRGREGAGCRAQHGAHSPAVLRGSRHQPRLYEWNYPRQLLEIRLLDAAHELDRAAAARELFTAPFLIKRPLLRALEVADGPPPVLLIDEIDRADEEFEGYLLEFLSDFQVTIPELGTIRAATPPVVVITSNRTREVHDALKRRCVYCWIDYPDFDKEYRILCMKVPDAPARLARAGGGVRAGVADDRAVQAVGRIRDT